MPAQPSPLLCFFFFFFFSSVVVVSPSIADTPSPSSALLLRDAVSILSFKSQADLDNKLLYTLHEPFDYCSWQGVKCVDGRVVRFFLPGFGLRGHFPLDSLSRLDHLRVLSLKNNSLTGPIPDLSRLVNLKTLILDLNSFSGSFPFPVLSLRSLQILDLSRNNFTGLIPPGLISLVRLNFLRLDSNLFDGSIPPLNQSGLTVFNVSVNNLTGAVPLTPTLKKFSASSFLGNPELCGEVINRPCRSSHFFDSPSSAADASPPTPLLQSAQSQGEIIQSPSSRKKRKNVGVVLGFVIGLFLLVAAVLCVFVFFKKRKEEIDDAKSTLTHENDDPNTHHDPNTGRLSSSDINSLDGGSKEEKAVRKVGNDSSGTYKKAMKSGTLVFCNGEAELYTLEVLMRGSAELLGRGTFGTTYKAVLANELIVTVKRLDSSKSGNTSGEAFEQQMEAVGVLRHPNLVPVRAYFQAKQEKLIVYDYLPSGSLFNLIHGSRSTRTKPLHWTSCLKITEDVAQGLAYIHQASNLIHGNLKSSNVLLGSDFEACLTDYCLIVFADICYSDDHESLRYKAPEIQRPERLPTLKADVYAFGVLLLELLTSKPPSQHPFLAAPDMPDWVRAMREDDIEEEKWVGMLVEIASLCSVISPEQRPSMRQVLKMIHNIKDCAMVENSTRDAYKRF